MLNSLQTGLFKTVFGQILRLAGIGMLAFVGLYVLMMSTMGPTLPEADQTLRLVLALSGLLFLLSVAGLLIWPVVRWIWRSLR